MTRISFELPKMSVALRERYPLLERLHVWVVSESRWCGWIGCDLYRITWANGAYERMGVTAPTLAECEAYIDGLLSEYAIECDYSAIAGI